MHILPNWEADLNEMEPAQGLGGISLWRTIAITILGLLPKIPGTGLLVAYVTCSSYTYSRCHCRIL